MALYEPAKSYPLLAQGLAALQAGNGTIIYTMPGGGAPYECDEKTPLSNMWELLSAVQCGDGADLGGSAADLVAYWNENKDYSSFADVMAASRVACMYVGPSFPLMGRTDTSFIGDGKSTERAVSWAPSLEIRAFLFLSSEIRLTRSHHWQRRSRLFMFHAFHLLRHYHHRAKKTAAAFPGAVVLTQDSPGVRSGLTCSSHF